MRRTLDAPLGTIPLHLRGGFATVMQPPALRTEAVRRGPMRVVAALPTRADALRAGKESVAEGHVYMDGGEDLEVR